MAGTIEKGITITFRGETAEFDKGVSKINGELKNLKTETKLLNKELKLNPNSFDALSRKMDTLKERETLLKEELDAYKQAMSQMDKSSDEFKKAEQKARDLELEIKMVEKAIDKMGGNKITLALNTIGTAFEKAGESVTKLGQKFAGLSAGAGAVLGGLAKLSVSTVSYADDINTLAKQTNLSTDTLQAFGQMASLIDVDLNTLTKSAVYLTKNITTDKAIENYKKLDVAIKDTNGSYRSTEDILFDTLKALQKVDDETERSIIASELFGKSYSQLGSIINDVGVDLDEVTASVRENGLIMSQEELDKLNKANDNLDRMKMTLKATGTALVSEFSEPIANVTQALSEMASQVREFVGNLSTEQKENILKVLMVVASISPVLLVVGKALTMVGVVLKTVGSVIKFIIPVLKTLWTIISANPLTMVITVITALVVAFGYLYTHSEKFRNIVNSIGQAIQGALISAFEWLKETIASVIEKIMSVISVVSQLWSKLLDSGPIQTIIGAFQSLVNVLGSVISALSSVFSWVGKVANSIGGLLASGISSIAGLFHSGGFGNLAYASGGYGALEFQTTINVNNNGASLTQAQAQQFGRQIVEYVNDKLGRRI